MNLSRQNLPDGRSAEIPTADYFNLPEKVLQFGTGVLLRGLPDFFIDRANKHGVFGGRVVVVKSTGGDVNDFRQQDNLYSHRICGIENGRAIDKTIINASISRVIPAQTQWKDILLCADDPGIEIIISNTTEVGIVLSDDDVHALPPASFPGKLLAVLLRRYEKFGGATDKGFVIIPTELITENGTRLKEIVVQLARKNKLDENFIQWIGGCNEFCNSLVDRIVPGKPARGDQPGENAGLPDELAIVSEPYALWAIESTGEKVRNTLSFAEAGRGIVIAPDITVYRELKLRLLNGTHTFCCGHAFLSGFNTVAEAMSDIDFAAYTESLMKEITPAITSNILREQDAAEFISKVLDRFRNPFIVHKWLSITLQYSSKMAMRNIPVIIGYYNRYGKVPDKMTECFAAHILFMKCSPEADGKYYGERGNEKYLINDDNAPFYSMAWLEGSPDKVVEKILSNLSIWRSDLNLLKGFRENIVSCMHQLISRYERIHRS